MVLVDSETMMMEMEGFLLFKLVHFYFINNVFKCLDRLLSCLIVFICTSKVGSIQVLLLCMVLYVSYQFYTML